MNSNSENPNQNFGTFPTGGPIREEASIRHAVSRGIVAASLLPAAEMEDLIASSHDLTQPSPNDPNEWHLRRNNRYGVEILLWRYLMRPHINNPRKWGYAMRLWREILASSDTHPLARDAITDNINRISLAIDGLKVESCTLYLAMQHLEK